MRISSRGTSSRSQPDELDCLGRTGGFPGKVQIVERREDPAEPKSEHETVATSPSVPPYASIEREGRAKMAHDGEHMEIRKVWSESAKVVELTSSDAPLAQVLAEVVSAARAITDSGCRSALFIHDLDESCLNLGVNGGLPQAYVDAIQGFKVGEHQPSCGRAVFIADEVIVPEINLDPRWAPFKQLAAGSSIRACWSFPIFSDNSVLGTLAVYHEEPTEPGAGELQAMRYLATIAAAAIGRSKLRAMFQEEVKTLPVTAHQPEPGRRSGVGLQSIRQFLHRASSDGQQAPHH